MTNFPTSVEFSKHVENLNAVLAALTQFQRAHKRAIRAGDQPGEQAMRKVHTLLLGVYAEARLRKIIRDPTGFSEQERATIWLERSQKDRWLAAVDLAVRRHYLVLPQQSLSEGLSPDVLARVDEVKRLLNKDLEPVITDRNRLAHGQWIWQLASQEDDRFTVAQASYDYNYVALQARFDLLDLIGRLVNALCVSEPTFTRDFDALMVRVAKAKTRLGGAGYQDLAAQLRRQRRAGMQKRVGNPE